MALNNSKATPTAPVSLSMQTLLDHPQAWMASLTPTSLLVALGTLFLLSSLVNTIVSHRRSGKLPPGPKRLPVIGNLLDVPIEQEWLTWAEWGRRYGPISSATVFGQHLIIVNSPEIAADMLAKKASIYSDRPLLTMFGDLCGYARFLSFLPYGSIWRRRRTLIQKTIGTAASSAKFSVIEEKEAHLLLKRIGKDPDGLLDHIRMAAGSIILDISYGYQTQENKDPLVDLAEHVMDGFANTLRPGAYLVDTLPFLKYVPNWFPGATFKRQARHWRSLLQKFVEEPYAAVKSNMKSGTYRHSFTSSLVEESSLNSEEENDIKWSSAMLFAGGADTTVSSLYSVILALVLNPEVQSRAQAEIDEVVGRDRLPSLRDRGSLPYLKALVTEAMRWHSVAPFNFRRVMEDDVQNGYLIPKNSTIVINQWQLLHDPEVYPEPMKFDPVRFLPREGYTMPPDPRLYAFGTGKRICPGRYLAEASIFIATAMILSVFRIEKKIGDDGKVIEPVVNPLTGATCHMAPYECAIKPRDSRAEVLIAGDVNMGKGGME
ncbi:cytochrome P450 [Marasmius fiardii PR-910]|nr:cytochrome P450 [Marasmius fiardii PR-910]